MGVGSRVLGPASTSCHPLRGTEQGAGTSVKQPGLTLKPLWGVGMTSERAVLPFNAQFWARPFHFPHRTWVKIAELSFVQILLDFSPVFYSFSICSSW